MDKRFSVTLMTSNLPLPFFISLSKLRSVMKKFILSCSLTLICQISHSQSFLFTDAGNTAILRPNIGFEQHWKNYAVSGLGMWKTTDGVWVSEFPGISGSSGYRIDASFKRFSMKSPRIYLEGLVRWQSTVVPNLRYWREETILTRYKKGIEIGPRVGITGKFKKRITMDLAGGVGCGFYDSQEVVTDLQHVPEPGISYEDALNVAKGRKSFYADKLRIYAMPYFQVRLYYRISEKQKDMTKK